MSTQRKELFKKIGRIIKSHRETAGYTQKDVADKFGYDTPQFVSNIERGAAGVPLDALSGLIKMLKIPPDSIRSLLIENYTRELDEALKINKAKAKKA